MNLLAFILTLLIYYGLMIIMGIALLIHWYDYVYNYEEFAANVARGNLNNIDNGGGHFGESEFKSPEAL